MANYSIIVGVIAFWSGVKVQQARYDDLCLDLGGGRNPNNYLICVVENVSDAFWIGPIRVTHHDVVEVVREEDKRIYIKLKQNIAKVLSSYTKQSVGQQLELRLHDHVINSVQIAEPLQTGEILIVLTSIEDANQLEALLASPALKKLQMIDSKVIRTK
ncbi:hypothetical protein B9T25_10560 [Acinetobacter sp. ANC 4470]|uniref:hypothetical protein n=1 Tax=Acinetobacter sp. ANC 4470 TaxID=1977881 RepID=UPI000B564827|nr:hypothetical protein [Acinetobacter sp. ANC 4470]OTG66236.1 hypothetical protein B9T25_10560 [Acinetobacter sp. ANC 4470]